VCCVPLHGLRLTSDDVKLCFRSTFLHTVLLCDYVKGRGTFVSDSVTVISILKEVIIKSATEKKHVTPRARALVVCRPSTDRLCPARALLPLCPVRVRRVNVDISLDVKDESVYAFLELLRPSLDHHFALARRHSLIEPLKEISTHENGDISYFTAEYVDILKGADDIRNEIKSAPRQLDFLRGTTFARHDAEARLLTRRVIRCDCRDSD
jgi:hypothetical protein